VGELGSERGFWECIWDAKVNGIGCSICNGPIAPCFIYQSLGFNLGQCDLGLGLISIGHVRAGCTLSREFKFAICWYLQGAKLWGQSRLSDVFGQKSLDHLIPFIFICVSLLLCTSIPSIDPSEAFPSVAHPLSTQSK